MVNENNNRNNTPSTQLNKVGLLFLTQTAVAQEVFLKSLSPRTTLYDAVSETALLSHESDLSII